MQIAMDQCKDSVTVKVGHLERRLSDIANERTTLRVMKEMRVVAKDVLGRLDADFSENSLYLRFEALGQSVADMAGLPQLLSRTRTRKQKNVAREKRPATSTPHARRSLR